MWHLQVKQLRCGTARPQQVFETYRGLSYVYHGLKIVLYAKRHLQHVSLLIKFEIYLSTVCSFTIDMEIKASSKPLIDK